MLFNSLLGSNDLNYSKQKNTRIDFIVYRAFTLLLWVVFFFFKIFADLFGFFVGLLLFLLQ